MDKNKERFLKKVRVPENEKEECWEWLAARTKPRVANPSVMPYGQFRYRGKTMGAHRASFLIFRDEIPRGMHVLHECDNPLCVNPHHLRLGYPDENIKDKIQRGRHWKKGTIVETDEMAAQAKQSEILAKTDLLKDLRSRGLLTKDQYQSEKKRVLLDAGHPMNRR